MSGKMDMSASAHAEAKRSEGKYDDDDEKMTSKRNDASSASVDIDDTPSMARMQEEHAVDVDEIRKSIREGSSHARGSFSYLIDDLPVRHDINRDVDLDEMTELDYVTEGSHSHIFSANWRGQTVIIKMLQADKADNDIAIYEFDIEVELLCRLDHHRIIRVLGAGRVPRPFIVLERLKDISEYLELNPPSDARKTFFQKKTLPMTEVLQIAKDIADALHYCHTHVHKEAMIIHRDLKPENLGMTPDKKVKLFDFGLCRCVRRTKEEDDVYNMTGNTGSLRYMAPEVVLNEPYNEKVDVFSFAMVVWAVAKGKPPFRGFDRESHRTRVVEAGERPKLEKSWPRDFCDLLVACWHQDSTQRPTFSVISGHLAQILEDQGKGSSSSGLSLFKKMSLGGFPSLRK